VLTALGFCECCRFCSGLAMLMVSSCYYFYYTMNASRMRII